MDADVTLFAGPTTCGMDPACLEGIRLLPPARRGDIDRLLEGAARPAVVVLCDGVFQSVPAVSHAELCRALDAGWQVWGVSSLGAIRAFELRGEGMRGFGEVAALFDQFEDFTDDEMCLLHYPEAPWFPLSEALVNVRHALRERRGDLGISDAAAALLVAELRALWFGDRTEARIRDILVRQAGVDAASADGLLAWLRGHRVKTMDLERLLRTRPWQGPDAGTR